MQSERWRVHGLPKQYRSPGLRFELSWAAPRIQLVESTGKRDTLLYQ